MKPGDFVGLMFLGRDIAHTVHLSTRSYAKHRALNSFYVDIIEAADKFAESYQGRHGLIGKITVPEYKNSKNIIEFLENQLKTIEEVRYDVCEKTDTPIQNIIDEICGLYLSTLYKLRTLA
jgi:RNA binding exosome subunit